MPDQSSASSEHALIQEITAPMATLPDDSVQVASEADFPVVLRGYDRIAVDAYVKKISQLVGELQATRSPEAAVRRALERVGEEISGILQRAHDTAEQITRQSRAEAEDRLEVARTEAREITRDAERRVSELDADADRIWMERERIVEDARELARQLIALAESAAARFPPADPVAEDDDATVAEDADATVPENTDATAAEGADATVAENADATVAQDVEATAVLPPVRASASDPDDADDPSRDGERY